MARKKERKKKTTKKASRKKSVKRAERAEREQLKPQLTEIESEEEWVPPDWYLEDLDESPLYHMTVGDLRQLIAEERYDMVNPMEEVGECSLCGNPVRLIDIAHSAYDDDTFIEDATDVVCRMCRGEVIDWDEYFEEGF